MKLIKQIIREAVKSAVSENISEALLERVPFLKEYNVYFKEEDKFKAQKIESYQNVQVPSKNGSVHVFKQYNPVSNITFLKLQRNEDTVYSFNVNNKLAVLPSEEMEPLFSRAVSFAAKMKAEQFSYSKEIVVREGESLTKKQLDEVIDNMNRVLFEFEEFTNQHNISLFNESKVIDEDYPSSFDMEVFKSLTSFAKRIAYCQEHLQRLSSGSSRIVYKVDEEKVLKLARNRKGLAQNEVEIDFSKEHSLQDIVAHTFDNHPDFLWVEMELAKKLRKSDFKRITGFNWEDFSDALFYEGQRLFVVGNARKPPPDLKEILKLMWEEEFFVEIFSYMSNYQIESIGDLRKTSSYGIVKRGREEDIVLIDYGLNNDVYNTYYSESVNEDFSTGPDFVQSFAEDLESKYDVALWMHYNKHAKMIILSEIQVPKEKREKGIGTKVMQEIVDFADKNDLPIALTPTSDLGGTVSRLKRFYRNFGFKPYKGYKVRQSMVRMSNN